MVKECTVQTRERMSNFRRGMFSHMTILVVKFGNVLNVLNDSKDFSQLS